MRRMAIAALVALTVLVPLTARAATRSSGALTISPDPVPVGHTFTVTGPACDQPTVTLTIASGSDTGPSTVEVPVTSGGAWTYTGDPLPGGTERGIGARCGDTDLGSGTAVSAAFVITGAEGNVSSVFLPGSLAYITGFGCTSSTVQVSLWHGGKARGPFTEPVDSLGSWSFKFLPTPVDGTFGLAATMPYGITGTCGTKIYPAHVVGLQYSNGVVNHPNQVVLPGLLGTTFTTLGMGCLGADPGAGPTGALVATFYSFRYEYPDGHTSVYYPYSTRALEPTPDSGWWITLNQRFSPPSGATTVRVRAEAACVPRSGHAYFWYPGRTVAIAVTPAGLVG